MSVLAPRPTPGATDRPSLPRVDPITRLPILILYPHSRCNCRCVMCDIWKDTTRSELSAESVAAWIDEWRTLGVQRVVLSGGEALLHSQLWVLCDHLRGAGIGITLLSTGLLLKRHAAELVRRCDDVVVSLDGPQAIHDRVRNVPRAYERLVEGVAAVRAADAAVHVTARCTVQRSNHDVLRATVAAAHTAGVERISFLAADVSSEAFNRPEGWDDAHTAAVALSAAEVAALATEIDALEQDNAEDFATGFIAESPAKLRRRLVQYFDALVNDTSPPANECNAPWVSSVIEADGTVRPCFFQPPLGNVHESGGLRAVLNSPQAIAWRSRLDVTRDTICRKCVCTLSLRNGDA